MALTLLVPRLAGAGEVKLGALSNVGYDSNVFRRDDDEVESAVFRLSAWGSVEDTLERGSYKARYQPTFFINESSRAKNTWNHYANVEGMYHLSPRTSLRVTDDFAYREKISFSPADPDPNANVNDSNRKTIRNSFALNFNHLLTRRTSFYAVTDYSIYRFSGSRQRGSDAFSGYSGLSYALSQKISVGGGGQLSYRSFDADRNDSPFCAGEDGPGSRTISYSGFASGSYRYDENTHVELRAGPARIETTDFQCGGLRFVSRDVNQTTWFAQGEFTKRWKRVRTTVNYRRFEGLGFVGTTTINDTVFARLTWDLSRRWRIRLRGGWIQRTQKSARNPTTQVKVDTDTTTWTAAGSLSWQILERLRARMGVAYRNQNQDRSVSNPLNRSVGAGRKLDFEVVQAFVGLTYEFDPIRY